jgi:hypothetical protein
LIFFVQGKPSMTLNLKFHLQNFILNLLMRWNLCFMIFWRLFLDTMHIA